MKRRDAFAATLVLGLVGAHAGVNGAPRYPRTLEGLRTARLAELGAYERYVVFSRRASEEAYLGVSYLFTALAASELIHAQNYERVLLALGSFPTDRSTAQVPVSDTRANLIYAAEREVDTIDNKYPALMASMEPEGHPEALRIVHYAWESHKQHRDMIDKIRKYSPTFFGTVARRINEKTDQVFICQICGSTVNRLPDAACPVCGEPASHYRRLDPGLFQS